MVVGMLITHLGHSAVLLEVAERRILIDPGAFSDAWHGLTDLDAILVTHQHPDHVDPEKVPALLRANPQAAVWVEPEVLDAIDLDGRAQGLAADAHLDLGALRIRAVGGVHAVIHRDIPLIGNVGLVVEAEGEPRLFHPGDSLAAVPAGVDVVAIPSFGPWAAMKETIDFVRAVDAGHGFMIHDELLNDRGRAMILNRVKDMCETDVRDLRGGEPATF